MEFNRNILVAVDESDNAQRAVLYVAEMLGGLPGFRVTLLHVIPDPDEDFFPSLAEKDKWIQRTREKVDLMLRNYRRILLDAGFPEEAVKMHSTLRYCPSMAECILAERDETNYSTIVLGRQGLSRSEEFLFGSISSKIVNYARNCTVWVVE